MSTGHPKTKYGGLESTGTELQMRTPGMHQNSWGNEHWETCEKINLKHIFFVKTVLICDYVRTKWPLADLWDKKGSKGATRNFFVTDRRLFVGKEGGRERVQRINGRSAMILKRLGPSKKDIKHMIFNIYISST
jgi:hypothetical protein